MIKNVYRSSCTVPAIPARLQWSLNFLDRVSNGTQISNFMKIRPVGAKLFHADRQTERQTDRQTNIQSRNIIFIALLLQQYLHERTSMLEYIYIACLVILLKVTCLNNKRRTGCCNSTTTMVTKTRHDNTFYIHLLSCSVQALLYRNAQCREFIDLVPK